MPGSAAILAASRATKRFVHSAFGAAWKAELPGIINQASGELPARTRFGSTRRGYMNVGGYVSRTRVQAFQRSLLVVASTVVAGILASLLTYNTADGMQRAVIVVSICLALAVVQYFVFAMWSKRVDAALLQARDSGLKIAQSRDPSESTAKNDAQYSAIPEPESVAELMSTAEVAFLDMVRKERAAIENAADVICIIGTDGTILSSNAASWEVWGYKPSELIGHNVSEYLISDDTQNTLRSFLGAENSIEKILVENRLRRKNGTVVDLLWSAHWSASDEGLFCIAHDISERKRSELLLRESEARIRLILEGLPAGVAVINHGGYIEFLNRTARTLIEFDQIASETADEQALPTRVMAKELFPDCKEQFVLSEFISSVAGASEGWRVLTRSGAFIPCEVSVRQLEWGGSPACLVIFMDASEKHAVEQAKRELMAMVSHDLRTPLTAIGFAIEFIAEGHGGTLTERGQKLAQKISVEKTRLLALVNDLLDLEKMKSGKFSMSMTETPLKSVVSQAIEVVDQCAALRKAKLVVSGEDVTCMCDGGRIIQVLVNLLDNAIKFTDIGQTVEIQIKRNDELAQVSVRNGGRQIPTDKLNVIFDSFVQARPGESIERKGTGLGLAICRTIIEQHGGKIWAESSPEFGTRFTFTLAVGEQNGNPN